MLGGGVEFVGFGFKESRKRVRGREELPRTGGEGEGGRAPRRGGNRGRNRYAHWGEGERGLGV